MSIDLRCTATDLLAYSKSKEEISVWEAAGVIMAKAWLMDHSEDEDEPVGTDWLVGVMGFVTDGPNLLSPRGVLKVWGDGQWSVVAGSHYRTVPTPKTRGEVRRLLAALGSS